MFSRLLTSLNVEAIVLQASVTALVAIMPSAFGRIISSSRTTPAQLMQDLCNRSSIFYNHNYNLISLSSINLVKNYSLCD
jgi:hypothetical protein